MMMQHLKVYVCTKVQFSLYLLFIFRRSKHPRFHSIFSAILKISSENVNQQSSFGDLPDLSSSMYVCYVVRAPCALWCSCVRTVPVTTSTPTSTANSDWPWVLSRAHSACTIVHDKVFIPCCQK